VLKYGSIHPFVFHPSPKWFDLWKSQKQPVMIIQGQTPTKEAPRPALIAPNKDKLWTLSVYQ